MLGWIAIIIGLLALLGICWFYRKELKGIWKRNKKKIAGVAVAGTMLGTGGMAVLTDTDFIIPEGYRPNTATMITNSNGRYWAATGANIVLALADSNTSQNSTVWLPGGDYTTTDTLYVGRNCTLIGDYSVIKPSGDFNAVIMYRGSTVEKLVFDISESGYNADTAVILPYNVDGDITPQEQEFRTGKSRVIRDIDIVGSDSQVGIGIYFHPRVGNDNFVFTTVENICCRYLNVSIKIDVDMDASYVNFNQFSNIKGVGCRYHIHLNNSVDTEITANTFDGVYYEAEDVGNEHYPIFLEGNCDYNEFTNVFFMDWIASGDTNNWVYLKLGAETDGARRSPDHNMFQGTDMYVTRVGYSYDFIVDETITLNNIRYNNSYQSSDNITTNAISISPSVGYGKGICPGLTNPPYDVGVGFYQKTLSNPFTYFYGNVAGSDMYGAFGIDSSGNFDFLTQSGNMQFAPSTGLVEVTGQLEIDGIEFDNDYMELDTMITNSNGNYWAATGANVQLAIDDCDDGDTVILPSGIIEMPAYLDMDEKTVFIKGAGRDITTIKQEDDLNSSRFIDFRYCQGGGLSDLTVDTNWYKNTLDSGRSTISTTGSNNLLFENIHLINVTGNGLSMTDNSIANNIWITDMHDWSGGSFHGFICTGNNSIWNNIIVETDNSVNGFGCDGFDFSGSTSGAVSNNTVSNIIIREMDRGGKITSNVNNCSFTSIKMVGLKSVLTTDSFAITDCQNISFYDFRIVNSSVAIGSVSGANGFNIDSDSRDISIDGLFISGRSSIGFIISGDNVIASNIFVKNCISIPIKIAGNYVTVDGFDVKDSSKVFISGANHVNLLNGFISESSNHGIGVKDSDNFTIFNVEIINSTYDGIDMTDSILGCANYSISRCKFEGNAKAIDIDAEDTWYFVDHNWCFGDAIDDNANNGLVEKNFGVDEF